MTTTTELKKVIRKLHNTLEEAEAHLEYCGYGDSWERECAEASKLEDKITKALAAGKKVLSSKTS